MTDSVRLRIEGRVQGVGYRDWLTRQARASGLRGWVRNRVDGSVEALLIGETEAADAVIAALQDNGSLTPGLNYYRANVPPETYLRRTLELPPVQAPTMAVSARGASITRHSPNSSWKPLVTLKAPP